MNFKDYCQQPENASCLTNLMYDMKETTGFDVDRLVEWVEEQADEEGIYLEGCESSDECEEFFANWYNELEPEQDGYYPRSGAV